MIVYYKDIALEVLQYAKLSWYEEIMYVFKYESIEVKMYKPKKEKWRFALIKKGPPLFYQDNPLYLLISQTQNPHLEAEELHNFLINDSLLRLKLLWEQHK